MTAPTATRLPYFLPNQHVVINHTAHRGQVFTVDRVKRTKAIVKPYGDPNSVGLDCPLDLLSAYTGPLLNAPANPTPAPAPEPPVETPGLGSVVRINRPFKHYNTSMLFAVIGINARTASLALLGGGENQRYIRVPLGGYTKVDLTDLGL